MSAESLINIFLIFVVGISSKLGLKYYKVICTLLPELLLSVLFYISWRELALIDIRYSIKANIGMQTQSFPRVIKWFYSRERTPPGPDGAKWCFLWIGGWHVSSLMGYDLWGSWILHLD